MTIYTTVVYCIAEVYISGEGHDKHQWYCITFKDLMYSLKKYIYIYCSLTFELRQPSVELPAADNNTRRSWIDTDEYFFVILFVYSILFFFYSTFFYV